MGQQWSGSDRKARLPQDWEQRRATTRDRQADDAKPPCATAHAALSLALTATTSCTAMITRSKIFSGDALGHIARRPHAKPSKRDASHPPQAPASHARYT